jgi:hypothetical protein
VNDSDREKIRQFVDYITADGFSMDAVVTRMERMKFEEIIGEAGLASARPAIVRANQTCYACPSQWDAWDADGSQYYLRYRHSYGSAERVRRGADEWLDGGRRETVGEFETDETDGGVISLEEFCERAGLELRLS